MAVAAGEARVSACDRGVGLFDAARADLRGAVAAARPSGSEATAPRRPGVPGGAASARLSKLLDRILGEMRDLFQRRTLREQARFPAASVAQTR